MQSVHEEGHLICHDHDPAIAQTPQWLWVIIALFVLEAYNFDVVVNLSILHDLLTKKVAEDVKKKIIIIKLKNKFQFMHVLAAFGSLILHNWHKAVSSCKGAHTDYQDSKEVSMLWFFSLYIFNNNMLSSQIPACVLLLAHSGSFLSEGTPRNGHAQWLPVQRQPETWLSLPQWGSVCIQRSVCHLGHGSCKIDNLITYV